MSIFDLNLPSIFSVALLEAKSPEDIIRIAMQMRREAKEFRAWCRELDAAKDPLLFLDNIDEAKDILRRLGSKIGSSGREERIQIAPLPGILNVQVAFKASQALERLYRSAETDPRMRRPLTFLLNLAIAARRIRSLRNEVLRVFKLPKVTSEVLDKRLAVLEETTTINSRQSPTAT